MKIWIADHYAKPPSEIGAIRTFSLAKYLIKLGNDVTIFACNYNHFTRKKIISNNSNSGFNRLEVEGVKFILIDAVAYKYSYILRAINMFSFSYKLFFVLKRFVKMSGKPDVVIGFSPNPFTSYVSKKVAERFNIKFIYYIRDLWPESIKNLKKFSIFNPLVFVFGVIEKYLFRSSERIITPIYNINFYLQEKGYKHAPVFIVANGADLKSLFYSGALTNTKLPRTFLYAGSHGLANGLEILIKAIINLKKEGLCDDKCKFILIGEGEQKKKIISLTKKNKLENVQFIPPLPKSQLHAYISKADVCLVALNNLKIFHCGISPNKLFEYLGLGKPVIVCNQDASVYYKNVNFGKFISANPSALAQAIEEFIYMSNNELIKMGKSAIEYVRKYGDLENIATDINKILCEL